jgi:very-short-patch-repair endonuclease
MEVIKNEFNDQDYIHEFPFYKYSLDFAWPNKKFCIEIDGEQHYRTTEDGLTQHKRDLEKDELLKANGWYEIRIAWSIICLNTKDFISFVKNALDNAELKDIKEEHWYKS